jgi:hypothetical protein
LLISLWIKAIEDQAKDNECDKISLSGNKPKVIHSLSRDRLCGCFYRHRVKTVSDSFLCPQTVYIQAVVDNPGANVLGCFQAFETNISLHNPYDARNMSQ